jgi:hypothetical protein
MLDAAFWEERSRSMSSEAGAAAEAHRGEAGEESGEGMEAMRRGWEWRYFLD